MDEPNEPTKLSHFVTAVMISLGRSYHVSRGGMSSGICDSIGIKVLISRGAEIVGVVDLSCFAGGKGLGDGTCGDIEVVGVLMWRSVTDGDGGTRGDVCVLVMIGVLGMVEMR